MKKTRTRIGSVLLAMAMLLTLLPVGALAAEVIKDESWTEATTLSENLTVSAGATLTLGAAVTVEGEVTISGGGTIARGEGYAQQLIVVPDEAVLTLTNITVDGKGEDVVKAMIEVQEGGKLVIQDGATLQNNNNTYTHGVTFGGAVYVAEGGALEMSGGLIQGNAAKTGGGVDCFGTMTMTGGEISGNTATAGAGGGVCSHNEPLVASNATFSKNSASANAGGGIHSNPGVTLTECTISGNTASLGGGLYVQDANKTENGSLVTASLTDCTVSDNTATGKYGGGIWCNSNLTVEGGTISGNKSTNQGGGIYGNGYFTINGTITGNESNAGGGVYIYQQAGKFGGVCIIGAEAVITENIARSSMGGGVVAWNDGNSLTHLTIEEGAQITNNTAASTVGGVYVNGKLDMNGGTITGNKVGEELIDVRNLAETNENISITGGTFSSSVSDLVSDELLYEVKSADGTYTYYETEEEAKAAAGETGTVNSMVVAVVVGSDGSESEYKTLQAAVNAAQSGDTIYLTADEYDVGTLSIDSRVNLVGAGADKTVINGSVSYKISEDQNGAVLSVSGITFKAGSNTVQGLQFRGDNPNNGYNMNIDVKDCAFEGWTYGITMNSHANGYDLTVSGCDFSKSFYAVSYNYDTTTTSQIADNTLTFGEGNTISDSGFAVQKFNNVNTGDGVVDESYATIDAFEKNEPTISGRVTYVTSDLAGAVSKAADGTTLIVAPGSYDGNITFGGKSLTIKAQYPAYKDGVKETDADKLSNFTGTFNTYGSAPDSFDENQKVVIEGFAFSGAGLKVGNNNYNSVGNLEVRNCTMVFDQNLEQQDQYNLYNYFVKVSGNPGEPYASVVVEDNYVSGTPVANVYPIQLWDVDHVVVRNNVVDLTGAENHQAISVSKMAADANVEITGNTVNGAGGGIYVTTWLVGGEDDNATAVFTGTITVKDNALNCAASESMKPIFLGYETVTPNQPPYGLLAGTQIVSGNTNNGTAVDAVIVNGPETSTVITATFMDGDSVVETISDTASFTVTIPAELTKEGYVFLGWSDGTSTYNAGEEVEVSADTTFTAVWSVPSSGSSSSYAITVEKADNGTVTASRTSASKNLTITLTVKADEGYKLDTITVTDKDGNEVTLTDKGDGKYTFAMPASAVTVEASFVEDDGSVETGLPFTDVKADDWFFEAVKYVYDNKLMDGTSATTFAPLMTTNRAMIVTILWRLEGQPETDATLAFTDVESGVWYTDAVNWAASQGIVKGYSDTVFAPNDTVTREQLATILYRYAESKGYDVTAEGDLTTFADGANTSSWAAEAMEWAVGSGLLSGKDGGKLDPTGTATRAEVATILMRFVEAQ